MVPLYQTEQLKEAKDAGSCRLFRCRIWWLISKGALQINNSTKKALQKPATQINLNKVCGKILAVLLYDLISSLQ